VTQTDRLDGVLTLLRSRGGRVTSARRGILQALLDHHGHPTAEQLTDRVHATQPDVDKSTVYRFLDDLEKLGVVDHVHLGHGSAVYHFVDDPHHHLVCEGCGAVVEVPSGAFERLGRQLQADYGFEIDPRHFALPGWCATCSPSC